MQHHHQYLNRSFEQDNIAFVPAAAVSGNSRLGVVSVSDVGAGGADASISMASSHNAGIATPSTVKDNAVGHRINVDDSDLSGGAAYTTSNVYRKGHR